MACQDPPHQRAWAKGRSMLIVISCTSAGNWARRSSHFWVSTSHTGVSSELTTFSNRT